MVEGYKHTEVGLIPNDWHLIIIGNEFTFKNGLNKEKQYFGYGTPIVNYMDVYSLTGIRQDEINGRVYLSQQEIKNYQVQKGDVLFTRTSETVEEIGISSVVCEELQNTVFSGFVLRGRPKSNLLEIEFCQYCFASVIVRKQILTTASYTTRALTNGRLLSEVKLPLPPTKAEQTAIATALNDADALIQKLEQLIDKKRNIKTGSMQELLKPKEGWEEKKLGEVLKIKHGKNQKEVVSENGAYPILASGGIIGRAISFLYNKPSVLIGRKGTIDEPQYMDTPFWSVDTLFYTEIAEDYDAKFIFYMFNLIDWYAYNEASGVPSLNAKTIELIEKHFPMSKSEQIRIAQILSDMDNEIQELERQLEKYKMMKQGMMQSLLTGKIRLV